MCEKIIVLEKKINLGEKPSRLLKKHISNMPIGWLCREYSLLGLGVKILEDFFFFMGKNMIIIQQSGSQVSWKSTKN